MDGIGQKIQMLREKAGLSPKEVAECLRMNESSYYDLELCDDDITIVPDLWQVRKLCRILGISMIELLSPTDGNTEEIPPLTFAEFAAIVRKKLADKVVTEDQLSWEVSDFLGTPSMAEIHPLDFITSISAEVGIDWRSLISAYDESKQGIK